MTMIDAALQYHRAGFSIIPIKLDKTPYIIWKEFQTKKPTESEVRKWWEQYPNAQIGIITGEINNLTVVDCDSIEIIESVQKLLPEGFVVLSSTTQRGTGKHFFFAYTPGLNSRSGIDGCPDVKSEGGYVIVPPSKGRNGSYTWNDGLDIRTYSDRPQIPPALLEYLKDRRSSFTGSGTISPCDEIPGDASKIFTVGSRNEEIFHIALKLAYSGESKASVRRFVLTTARGCLPPLPEKEALKIVESVFQRLEKRQPWINKEAICADKEAEHAPPQDSGHAITEFRRLIEDYGDPYYLNKEGSVSSLNQVFWAGLHKAEHIQLYEPYERDFYRYTPENGLYSTVSENIIKKEIASRILKVSRQREMPSLEHKRTDCIQNHIVAQLKCISEKKNAFQRGNKYVHLTNGVIVFKENRETGLYPFSHDFYSRNQCPIPFNADATCERFLKELLYPAVAPEDAVLLQKYTGLCLLGNNLIQKILILDGQPGRGKSTLALIIQKLIGLENITELRTKQLDERFELFRYLRKTLLIGVDVPGNFLSEKSAHVLKGLVGGDSFDAEQKGGTGSFPIQGNFCVLITSNSRLQVKLDGDTGAWKRRLLIIRFEAPAPPKKIPDFSDALIRDEGSGILNWALDGLRLLLKDIEEHGDIHLEESQEKIVDCLLAESDSLRNFLQENIVQKENRDISTTEIVEAYAEYCPRKGWYPKPITLIQRDLESLMLELFGTAKANSICRDGKSTKGFRRVSFKLKE